MEVPIGVILGAAATLATNVAGIVWLTRWLTAHRKDIKELFTKVDTMMTKAEIVEMVILCNEPIKENMQETKTTLMHVTDSVNAMAISLARMDERMKIKKELEDAAR